MNTKVEVCQLVNQQQMITYLPSTPRPPRDAIIIAILFQAASPSLNNFRLSELTEVDDDYHHHHHHNHVNGDEWLCTAGNE